MRQVNPELLARLEGDVSTLARAWIVTRRDGVSLGFTDHDRDLVVEGVVCLASAGFTATALEQSTGLAVDTTGASGALQADTIREEDIAAGRYDGAEVRRFLVDWMRPDLTHEDFRGSFGEIRRGWAAFEVELRGLSEPLNAPVGRTIVRCCDATLGDARCGVDTLSPDYQGEVEIVAVLDPTRMLVTGIDGYAQGWFAGGFADWTTGDAHALSLVDDVTQADGARVLRVARSVLIDTQIGARLTVTAGCDKRSETCRAKFGNFLNFRGFPHVPGEDWGIGYPRQGELNDGGSLFGSG